MNQGSIDWAEENMIRKNPYLKDHMIDRGGSIRLQKDPSQVLEGVIY